MKIQIELKNKDKMTEEIIKIIEKKLDAALNDIVDFIGSKSDEILRSDDGAFDTGFLANSLVVDKDEFLRKEVGYEAAYAPFVCYGTSPHFPPLDVIYNWLWRKRNDLNLTYDTKKKTKLNGKLYITGILNISWAIAKKMSMKGTEPKPFLRPAFNLGISETNEFIKKRTRQS